MKAQHLDVVLVRPTNYGPNEYAVRERWGFMPNSTLTHIRSMTPDAMHGCTIRVITVDEHAHTDLEYLHMISHAEHRTLVVPGGVQSREFHRALDLGAFALEHGALAVMGGPHPMTCDTTQFQGRGLSFALAEAELIWPTILSDAILEGELRPVYGKDQRWKQELNSPVLIPPSRKDLRRNVVQMLGIYPARGCPFRCNFCSVIKIAGQRVRSEPVEITVKSLLAAKRAGVQLVMFTCDNFNKIGTPPAYSHVRELLQAMIDEKINVPFFVQCDVQISKDPALVDLLRRAGCWQIFLGFESFDRVTLLAAKKSQNRPEDYADIVRMNKENGIVTHAANIIGFPSQTERDIHKHLQMLKAMDPEVASFYVLTPIPGTEQCEEFLDQGLIPPSVNLDRMDGTWCVWDHPHISKERLRELVFRCYTEFYKIGPTIRKIIARQRVSLSQMGVLMRFVEVGYFMFARIAAEMGEHPMSGGVFKKRLDSMWDYMNLRKKYFGITFAPMPRSIGLSVIDREFNRSGAELLEVPS